MESVDDWIVLRNQDFKGKRKLVRGLSVYGKHAHAYIYQNILGYIIRKTKTCSKVYNPNFLNVNKNKIGNLEGAQEAWLVEK